MRVGVTGTGAAAEAVRAALADTDAAADDAEPGDLDAFEFGIVVGEAGDRTFEAANDAALAGGTPWLAVEVEGLGGRSLPDVAAAVSGFAPAAGCYDCLRARVAANVDGSADEAGADEVDESRGDVRLAGAVAGREAAALLAGEESSILGGVVEVPHARRTFLPVPGCEACGGARDRTLRRDDEPAALDDSLARAERAVDDRVGIVRRVGEAESFPLPYYLATICDTTGFSDVQAAEQAAGVAADWDEALVKALGESLERYSAGVCRANEFTTASANDLPDAVPPEAFVRPDDSRDPGPDIPLPWVAGESLATGDAVHLPAEFVQFPPVKRTLGPAITTGLGLGNSGAEALLSGLYEVIERDATMLAWYSTFDPLGLAVEDEGFAELAKRARAESLSVTPLLVTQDVDVPVVTVAVHREEGWPRFAVGSGAALDPDAAARSALAEALQNWTELRGMGPDDAADERGAIGEYADFPAAAREFVDVDSRVPSASVGPNEVPEGTAELDALVERVAGAGLDPYAARVTPRDVETLGFEAVRVLVPTAQPLFTGDPFFGDRAERVPRDLGFEPRPGRAFHPYP